MEEQKPKGSGMEKIATFIVDKRNLFFLLYAFALIFSIVATGWVKVENDITTYLPEDTETRQGLTVMNDNFVTYGTARVMVSNVTYETAENICSDLESIDGVTSVDFDDTTDHYKSASALFSVTFDGTTTDDISVHALHTIRDMLAGYDTYIDTEVGVDTSADLQSEMSVILVLAAIVIVLVLTLTSRSYAEVPVLIMTFGAAALLNMGTNFLCGTISFISNSVTVILQLALAIDYAIILCHRFSDEHETKDTREACIAALSKAIPEISSSSLTTISGLGALAFMHFGIGRDMATVLIKAILFSLLSVFTLMPGLLMLFGPYMSKTKHRNFVPKISFVGRYAYKTRKIVPIVFAVVLVFAYHFQTQCPYAYGYGPIKTPVLNETQIADNMIDENFTKSNLVALVVPKNDDYRVEAAMIKELESHDEVDHTRGLSNIEAMDGYMLEDRLTSRQFSEMAGLDYELAQVVYTGYALENDEYGQVIGNFSNYSVPLIDMFLYVCDEVDSGIVSLDQDQIDDLHDAQTQMLSAKAQLQGADYNRILVYLNPSLQSGDEMYEFTDQMRTIARKYYPDGDIYLAGDATNEYDFQKSFAIDNIVVSVVSVLIVLIVLLFTFQSVAMPILLILVIEGAIWVNFSVPAFIHTPLYFMGYLIVSSIQMGANIDYAIVIATRYNELRDKMDHKTAMIETLNFAFPTILTSGTIMTVAGTLIGQMTSDACIVGIGQCLGRGTIISIFLVLFVLPQILLVGGKLVDKTSFSMHHVVLHTNTASGRVRVNGMVQGEVNGSVAGTMNAIVDGNVHLTVLSGKISQEVQDENDSHADE